MSLPLIAARHWRASNIFSCRISFFISGVILTFVDLSYLNGNWQFRALYEGNKKAELVSVLLISIGVLGIMVLYMKVSSFESVRTDDVTVHGRDRPWECFQEEMELGLWSWGLLARWTSRSARMITKRPGTTSRDRGSTRAHLYWEICNGHYRFFTSTISWIYLEEVFEMGLMLCKLHTISTHTRDHCQCLRESC